MKIRELSLENIKVGLRVKSLVGEKFGTVVRIERSRDNLTWILWDNEYSLRSAFNDNNCECEIVEESNEF